MAISEICKFEVKKEIDSCVEEGMSRREAARWLADVFSEELGRKINSETIRKKDQRVRKEVGTFVPNDDEWPTCKNVSIGKCVHHMKVARASNWKPAAHGLCLYCRKKELAEQRLDKQRKEFEKAQQEFEQIPIDQDADQVWSDFAGKLEELMKNVRDEPICAKISTEVFSMLSSLVSEFNHWFDDLYKESIGPQMPST